MKFKRHYQYFKAVINHKRYVYQEGRKLGLGRLRLILHDWDKLLPGMWLAYARTFYDEVGNKQYKPDPMFQFYWLRHQNWNRHHYQYWMLTLDSGKTELLPMPDADRLEMLADWRGAGRAYGNTDTAEWFRNRPHLLTQIHPETLHWIQIQLGIRSN